MPQVEILTQKGYDFLWIDGELWMWNIPEEQAAQKHIANQAYGHVLVAGYGLGLLQKYLTETNDEVKSVTTIEVHKEVIVVCARKYGMIYGGIEYANFYSWFDDCGMKYDCVIGDIWKDIIPECLHDYMNFKMVARLHLARNGKILAWGQELFEHLIEKEVKTMGRELKRVPLDFAWPIGAIWWGYLAPDTEYIFRHAETGGKTDEELGEMLCENWFNQTEPPEGDGYQLWETTSEGSPKSPVFKTLGELCKYAAHNCTVFANIKISAEEWEELLGSDGPVIFKRGNAMFI